MLEKAKVGDMIKFTDDRLLFKIVGRNKRFIIAITKGVNNLSSKKKDWFYTIIDTVEEIRGGIGLVFNHYDFSNNKDIEEVLSKLGDGKYYENQQTKIMEQDGELFISFRNRVKLLLEDIR